MLCFVCGNVLAWAGQNAGPDLVGVGVYRNTKRVVQLEKNAAKAFLAMRDSALKDGVKLIPVSGYRSLKYQKYLFARAIKKYGSEYEASRWVAKPGESEHQTGTALDIGDLDHWECDTKTCFKDTCSYKWLENNASKFGFALSYPPSSTTKNYEPWHWRYEAKKTEVSSQKP